MQEEQIMYRGSKTFSPALRYYTWYTQVLRTVNSHYTQKGSQPLQPNCAMGSSEKNANYTGRTASCSGSQAVPLLTFPCLHVLLGAGTWVGTQWGALQLLSTVSTPLLPCLHKPCRVCRTWGCSGLLLGPVHPPQVSGHPIHSLLGATGNPRASPQDQRCVLTQLSQACLLHLSAESCTFASLYPPLASWNNLLIGGLSMKFFSSPKLPWQLSLESCSSDFAPLKNQYNSPGTKSTPHCKDKIIITHIHLTKLGNGVGPHWADHTDGVSSMARLHWWATDPFPNPSPSIPCPFPGFLHWGHRPEGKGETLRLFMGPGTRLQFLFPKATLCKAQDPIDP